MSADLNQFSTPINSESTISESMAVEKAMRAVASSPEGNPTRIQAKLLIYREALQQLQELIIPTDNDEQMNRLVWLVEMSGTFKSRHSRRALSETLSRVPKTKAYVILGAADGVPFSTHLSAEPEA